MTDLFDPSWFRPTLSVLCYLGIVLYGGVLSVPGRSRYAASWQLLLIYLGLFPLPGPSLGWIGQQLLLAIAVGSLGPELLSLHLKLRADLGAERRGRDAARLPRAVLPLIYLPAVAAVGWGLWDVSRALLRFEGNPAPVVAAVQRGWAVASATLAAYFAAAWLLGRRWLRTALRIRLLSTAARFHLMNAVGAIGAAVVAYVFATEPPGSIAVQITTLAVLVGTLLAGLNELAWSYDAVLSRVIAFHAVALVVAGIALGARFTRAVGLSPVYQDVLVIALVAIVATTLPGPIYRAIELRLFPRAGRLRARLAELAGTPLSGPTRLAAAGEIASRAVEALDAEGGIVVAGATDRDPAVLAGHGRVDTAPLGPPADAERYLGTLLARERPVHVERLAMHDQLRLLRCGIVLLVPFSAGRARAALLLGPRRGWLYDTATVEAVGRFAGQSGLALENWSLVRARVHAEKLAALGEAAARIAHEIRNPLASARSLVQLTAREGPAADIATTALVELDRIGRLVTDLVAFARRDEALRMEEVDLAGACDEALAQVQRLAERAQVTLDVDLVALRVRGDRDRLVQVVANLCRNAIEAVSEVEEPRRVALRMWADHGRALLEVTDNGPGISAAEIDGIFEPFHTTKSAGTGLGLPISKRIVEAHGGTLTARRVDGGGASFWVEMPLVLTP